MWHSDHATWLQPTVDVRAAVVRVVGADDDRVTRLDRAVEEMLGPEPNDL